MLDHTRAELEKHSALTPHLNPHLQHIVEAIPFTTVHDSMKAIIAASQLVTFASQFRRNVLLWDDVEVPVNAISFVITGSGNNKDSSVHAARKCFNPGYDLILAEREKTETQRAIKRAIDNDEDPAQAETFEIYRKYLRPLPPIDITPTTGPGLIKHINDISDLDTTAGFMFSGELSDELAYNPDMAENIKILSETFDLGNKAVTYTKGVEHRSKAITGQAVSALFVGSPGHILYDEATKKKFHVAFMSKLARRSWFCYSPERLSEPNFSHEADPIGAMLAHKRSLDDASLAARKRMANDILSITKFGLATAGKPLQVSDDVRRLFEVYKRYNSELADSLANQDSTTALIRRHLQWKSLKLAGALAIFDKSDTLELSHYISAIQFAELFNHDMERFEFDLNKSPHERFSDYIRTLVQSDGRAVITLHDLKKNNYLSTTSIHKLQELVHLASGYDTSGIYSIINEGGAIQYEPIIKTDVVGISYKPINTVALNAAVLSADADAIRTAKHAISVTTAYGFEIADTTFEDLGRLLKGDYAYSPFRFSNGIRGKDNIVGGTKWITLDIDASPITASEAHFMLSDINHHIALSSDPHNDFKFRVLIELDSVVELSAIAWKHFYLSIAEDLALHVDPLPQSQIFFSYANRPVLSNLDASPLEARPYIMLAKERELTKETRERAYTPSQKAALLGDALTTFHYAFEAPNGTASRNVIRAMYHLRELGGNVKDALSLYEDIQDYWDIPFESSRSEAMQAQISRMF